MFSKMLKMLVGPRVDPQQGSINKRTKMWLRPNINSFKWGQEFGALEEV